MKSTTATIEYTINTRAKSDTMYRVLHKPRIEIVIPVLNEATIVEKSVRLLDEYLKHHLPYQYQIIIADNGSNDNTKSIARQLSNELANVQMISLNQRGRGRALKYVWQRSQADILTYMDVDLSTNLEDFLPMITPLVTGEAGVAIGTRLSKQASTTRGLKREIISRCYNKIIKLTSKTTFSDAQCGFKAIRRDVAKEFLPKIRDDEWFFDTELLIKTERSGVPIHEQPVTWIEDTDSRVNIVKTAIDDIKGLARVNKELTDVSWIERLFLPALLLATGALYLFGALHNDMANSYYAAAVQAASQNWTAWLFGSLDAANYVSVDKPPLATMIMGLSARIFGFSSFSMLLPSILSGVGSVWLIYSIVKRQFGFKSAAIAGIVLAFTPVAALMFGFNNPDAILTVLLTASGYAFLRSLEQKKPLFWLSIAALCTGLAFNTKMLQGLIVVPAMGIVYLAFAKPPLLKRVGHLLFAGVIAIISTFWWTLIVWLTPASNRPWVGSTTDNNIWSLVFGYNGFGRLLGNRMGNGGGAGGRIMQRAAGYMQQSARAMPQTQGGTGGGMRIGGGPGGSGFGGETGILRMFNSDFGPNIGWLLLVALVGGLIMLLILRRTPRDNRGRAAVVFWLLWLIVHIIVFSMTSGTIHPYYVIVMAPAVAALVGISLPFLWAAYIRRKAYAVILPSLIAVSTIIATILLGYDNAYPWLTWFVTLTGVFGSVLLLIGIVTPIKKIILSGAIVSATALAASPIIYTLSTVSVTHTGSIPTSGPKATAMGGSNNESATISQSLSNYLLEHQDGATWIVAVASANQSAAIQLTTGQPVMAVGGFNGSDTPLTLAQFKALITTGKLKYYAVSTSSRSMGGGPGGNSEIATWVTQNGTKVNYGVSDVTLYKLSV